MWKERVKGVRKIVIEYNRGYEVWFTYEIYLKVSQVKKKGCQETIVCVKAKKTDSPHGSGESSDVIYDDYPLLDFMLNHLDQL